jgi:hypothetical protein
MIINVSVAVSRLIDECNIQTSLDLQAMRARGVETANAVYDDWVMHEDVFPLIYPLMGEYAADMALVLRTMVESYDVDTEDQIRYTLNIADDMKIPATANNEAMSYFKYKVLAWWYQYRDAELSVVYANKAEVALNNVFMLCIPRTGTSIGRYF